MSTQHTACRMRSLRLDFGLKKCPVGGRSVIKFSRTSYIVMDVNLGKKFYADIHDSPKVAVACVSMATGVSDFTAGTLCRYLFVHVDVRRYKCHIPDEREGFDRVPLLATRCRTFSDLPVPWRA